MNKIKKILKFLQEDIWNIKINSLPKLKALAIIHIRVIILSLKGFFQDKCQIRASALTFFSLLSIVPVFAFLFGLAKGFGFENILENIIMDKIGQTQPEVADKLILFSKNALSNVKGGMIAGIGLLILFWTVIKLLGNIENSFNEIWGVKKPRPLIRKITDYLSIIVLSFIILILASGLNVFIKAKLVYFSDNVEFFAKISAPAFFLLNISPYILIWFAFTFIYLTLPNTNVPVKSAIIGGIVAGTIFQIFQKAYILFQLGVSKYNAIYGSLAAMPLFLIWLQLSWIVVLFGAEVTFAAQTHKKFEKDIEPESLSQNLKEVLSLKILIYCIKKFIKGLPPATSDEISEQLNIPIKIVRDLVFKLTNSNLLIKVCKNEEEAFTISKDINHYTIFNSLFELRNNGINQINSATSKEYEKLKNTLKNISELIQKSEHNKNLKEFIL